MTPTNPRPTNSGTTGAPTGGSSMGRYKPIHLAWVGLIIIWVTHLVGQLFFTGWFTSITQVLLMPLLAAVLYCGTARPRGRLVCTVLIALFFSWLGDAVPRFLSGDTGFLAMVGFFLIAQVFYILAFLPLRARAKLKNPVLIAAYAMALGALIALCYKGAGTLFIPVVIYGLALAAMALLATGLGLIAAIGGAIFFISDSLIALRSFAEVSLPAHGFWVMATYVLGQILIVVAVRHHHAHSAAPAAGQPHHQ